MARDSCIEHPKRGLFIVIKQSYVNLFAGDHAFAALMYCFEHFTNIEEDRNEREELSPPEVWVEAPMVSILHQCTGLYSERALKPRVLVLERLGLIKVGRGRRGTTSRYLLDCDKVNAFIKAKHVFSEEELSGCKIAPDTECKIAPVDEPSGANSGANSGAKLHPVPIISNELRIKNTHTEEAECEPSSDLNQERLMKVLSGHRGRVKGAGKLNAADRTRLGNFVAERSEAQDDLIARWDRFHQDPYWAAKRFPVSGFIAQFDQYAADAAAPTVEPESWPDGWDSIPAPVAKPQQAAPRDFVAEWNAVVKAKPIEWNARLSPTKNLSDCASNLEFRERFAEVCELAQKAHECRGADVGYINFAWIIKQKDGVYGWWRLLTDLRDQSEPKPIPKTRMELLMERA